MHIQSHKDEIVRTVDISLHLVQTPDGSCRLLEQNSEWNLLTSIAESFWPDVQILALEIIYRYGFTADTNDALRAYAKKPLKNVPDDYWREFRAVDWAVHYQPEQLKAIILAGAVERDDIELLERIIVGSCHDMRDGAICAAAARNEARIVDAVVEVARKSIENNERGDWSALMFCFRLWNERQVLSLPALVDRLQMGPETGKSARENLYVFLKSVEHQG